MEEPKLNNAIYDNPQDTDFLWKDYVAWTRKRFPGQKLKVRNQNASIDTISWCGIYWLTYIYNWNQINEFEEKDIEREQEDPKWKRYTFQAERWNPGNNVWSTLQDCIKFFKDRKLIDWYLTCKNSEECKNAIKNWFWVYTGTNKCNRKKTDQSYEFEYDEDWASHCIAIVDYDDTGFWSINSFWETRWKKWFFHIDYDKYKYLYTTYAIIDHDDSGQLEQMVYNMQYQKAIELWITNWTRPDEPATRRQVAVQIYRMYKTLKW